MRKYLDPSALARLQGLELKARMVVEGSISGMHKSPFKGFSVEFSEHKPYIAGDDLRYIDWKMYGKTDKFFIKQFEEDTNVKSYILLDSSSSMAFGHDDYNKFNYASFMAICLSYLMLSQRDSVGLTAFDRSVAHFIPPRNDAGHLHHMVSVLEKLQPDAGTNICHALKYLASYIKRRALIILISDLIDNQDNVLKHLAFLRKMKHEIIILHLVHPDEQNLPFRGTSRFIDSESDAKFHASSDTIRKSYRNNLERFLDTYKTRCWQLDINYHRMILDQPVESAILDFIAQRRPR